MGDFNKNASKVTSGVKFQNCSIIIFFYIILTTHPGSGSDRTIASERQNTALATLYIGGSVTCSQTKTQGV